MKLRYLLDTNICIYIAKKKPLEVYQRLSTLNVGEVAMSAITFGELRYGAEKSQHREIALQKLVQLEQYIADVPKRSLGTRKQCIIGASRFHGRVGIAHSTRLG